MSAKNCFFVSDLHGSIYRYNKLIEEIKKVKPEVVFFGGDLLPHALRRVEGYNDFAIDFLIPEFLKLKNEMKGLYPEIFLILGNDDFRSEEHKIIESEKLGIWNYLHYKFKKYQDHEIFGYTYVPITPFRIKDWEKYDLVKNNIRPGCIPIANGFKTADIDRNREKKTIKKDMESLTVNKDLSNAIFILHSPPYNTYLDRAGLDGIKVDGKQLDVHVGSEAIRKFIEEKQPLLTLHGHIHESTKRTGQWKQKIGRTVCMNASFGGSELCLVKFNIDNLEGAERILI